MSTPYRAQFDFIVLKPISIWMLAWAASCFFRAAWGYGALGLAMAWSVGIVGARLHRSLSFEDLAAGRPTLSRAHERYSADDVSAEEVRAAISASYSVSFIVGVVAAALALQQHSWVFSLCLGFGICWVGGVLIATFFGLIARQFIKGNLRSAAVALPIFWLGVCAVVLPLGIAIRALSSL